MIQGENKQRQWSKVTNDFKVLEFATDFPNFYICQGDCSYTNSECAFVDKEKNLIHIYSSLPLPKMNSRFL